MTVVEDIVLQKDAVFIADSHFKRGDTALLESFSRLPSGVQVFLMGDVFHLLVGCLKSSRDENEELISALAALSLTNQIILLEGNHDFGLKGNCENVGCKANLRIYPHKSQPIVLRNWRDEVCILAHGDLWISPFYGIYRWILDSKPLMFFFRLLDSLSRGWLYALVSRRVSRRLIASFAFYRSDSVDFMGARLGKYKRRVIGALIQNNHARDRDSFCIIEGHFHLGASLQRDNICYIALPSSYFTKGHCVLQVGGQPWRENPAQQRFHQTI